MLHLGPIDDRDTTWVNGVRVGGLDVHNAAARLHRPGERRQGREAA